MRVGSWEQAMEIGLREAERRLSAKIKKYWVSSISLEPKTHGGLWNVRLELQVEKRMSKKLIKVAIKIDPETGEIREFSTTAGSARAI